MTLSLYAARMILSSVRHSNMLAPKSTSDKIIVSLILFFVVDYFSKTRGN